MKGLKLTRPLAVIDVETTGLNKQEDRIIDICITKMLPNGNEETLKSLINPAMPIPLESTSIHRIKDEDVKDKPTFKEFAQKIIDFVRDCDLCGYELKFDLEFLGAEFKRAGINYQKGDSIILDVKQIHFKLDPRDLSSAYLKYCGKKLENPHRAEGDVKATIEILEAQLAQHNELPNDVSALQQFSNPRDPSWIDNEGKIRWYDGKAVINFGFHQGKALEYLAKNASDYLRWVTTADFSPEVKRIVNEALEGRFPKPESNILSEK